MVSDSRVRSMGEEISMVAMPLVVAHPFYKWMHTCVLHCEQARVGVSRWRLNEAANPVPIIGLQKEI